MYTANPYPCNENRVFPVYYFQQGKNLFSSTGNPAMKTGFSLCGNTTQGKPCSGPVLALYWPCKGLQCKIKPPLQNSSMTSGTKILAKKVFNDLNRIPNMFSNRSLYKIE